MRKRFMAYVPGSAPVVVADTTAPSVPTGVISSGVTGTGFTLSWNASTDNVGVTGYSIQVNGAPYGTSPGTFFTATGLTTSTTYAVRVQAYDAAGNFSALSTAVSVTTAAASSQTAQASLFPTQTPTTPNANDGTSMTLGTRFSASVPGKVTGIRFYAAASRPTSAQGLLYADTGDVLFQGTFPSIVAGWNVLTLPTPIDLTLNSFYRVAYWTSSTYVATSGLLSAPVSSGPLTATGGYYTVSTTPAFPTSQFGGSSYFADVVFEYLGAPQTVPSAPVAPVAVAGNGQANLLWDAPASDGNSVITGYDVQIGAAGTIVSSGINLYRAVTGLTNGTSYQFRVRAVNSVGAGAWSALSAAVTPDRANGLLLPLVPWEGGPAYWKKFSKADAANWDADTFFPMMSFSNSFSSTSEIAWDQDHGINVYHGLNPFSDWSLLTTTGMFYVGDAYTYQNNNQPMPANLANWIGYNMPDEIDGTSGSGQAAVNTVKGLADGYRALNDGRIITANYTQTTLQPSFQSYSDQLYNYKNIDGVSIDMYWYTIPSSSYGVQYVSAVNGPVNPRSATSYGAMVRGMRQINATSGKLKPMWMFVECLSGSPGEVFVGDITPAQLKGAVMSSIIAEARGIMWFNNVASQGHEVGNVLRQAQVGGSGFRGATQIAAMKEVNTQVKTLAPVINTQSYAWTFGPNLETMLKAKAGFAYIFAMCANGSTPGSRTFTLPSGINGTSVEVVDEARTLPVTAGKFTDTFAAESTYHIYKIAVGQATPAGKYAYIGDSLTYQAGTGDTNIPPSLASVGWSSTGNFLYSWPGKQINKPDGGGKTTVQNIQAARATLGAEPALWIIALATNDNQTPYTEIATDMQAVFTELGANARVMWVNEGTANNNNQQQVNDVIATQCAARPKTTVADWYTYVMSVDQTGFWTDGTHMTDAGWAVRNQFIAQESLNAIN